MSKPLFLFLTGIGLLIFAWLSGQLWPFFSSDRTGVVWLISALASIGTLCAKWRRPLLIWLTEYQVCTLLGLLGTVLGLWFAVSNLSGAPGIEQISGALTALSTTVAGLVAHLWLMLVREATR